MSDGARLPLIDTACNAPKVEFKRVDLDCFAALHDGCEQLRDENARLKGELAQLKSEKQFVDGQLRDLHGYMFAYGNRMIQLGGN